MPLITCPDCKKEISDKAKACPSCGCPVVSSQQRIVSAPEMLCPKCGKGNVKKISFLYEMDVRKDKSTTVGGTIIRGGGEYSLGVFGGATKGESQSMLAEKIAPPPVLVERSGCFGGLFSGLFFLIGALIFIGGLMTLFMGLVGAEPTIVYLGFGLIAGGVGWIYATKKITKAAKGETIAKKEKRRQEYELEPVSKVSENDCNASDSDKSRVNKRVSVPSHNQAPEIMQPGKATLDPPALFVSS